MNEDFKQRIHNLRKQSRLLLAKVDEKSKKIKSEIEKLHSTSLLDTQYDNCVSEECQSHNPRLNLWKLRNDSSGVAAALYFDYLFNKNQNHISIPMPRTSALKRIVISSKRQCDHYHPTGKIHRKPTKECYCNVENKRTQLKSSKNQHKQYAPGRRCKSHANFITVPNEQSFECPSLNSPISCETLRRVQKIDYTPKSQFLRNIRSRISRREAIMGKGDCIESCPRSQCYHQYQGHKDIYSTNIADYQKTEEKTTQTSNELIEKSLSVGLDNVEEYSASEKESTNEFNKGAELDKQLKPKATAKQNVSKNNSNIKRNSRTRGTAASRESLHDYKDNSHFEVDTSRNDYINAEKYKDTQKNNFEADIRELGKFREQNYFDTHGSNRTLSSTKSSGSLEQYVLNDRLFAEPIGKIHKKDLVVSMPPCATLQRKRVHYFPRYIVRQEKNNLNPNNKKKRCQTCPLTGHAIDLGITKIRLPINSLALKYQKRLP